jgi:hypothetical protein
MPKLRARDVAICIIVDALEDLPMDQGFRVEVHEHKATRSDQQNRTIWWVYDNILRLGGNTMAGWLREDLHEFFLCKHFGSVTKVVFGRTIESPVRRSSRLSRFEFMQYMDFVYSFMASQGVILPQPDPDHAIEREEEAA